MAIMFFLKCYIHLVCVDLLRRRQLWCFGLIFGLTMPFCNMGIINATEATPASKKKQVGGSFFRFFPQTEICRSDNCVLSLGMATA